MVRTIALTVFLVVSSAISVRADTPATRVVSLDFCADQFVLKLLPPTSILALSPDAEKDFSYMRASASGMPTVRPVAEDILMVGPALVVRSYGGGPHASRFFERAGIPVLQLPFSDNIADIRESIGTIAKALSVSSRGVEIIAEMDARLRRLSSDLGIKKSVLYMTPTGVTSGAGTLIDDMLQAAGLRNYQQDTGWRSLPLEKLAYVQPDIVAAAFFDTKTNHPAMWSAMRHPVARKQISELPTVLIDGAWTACGGWFLLDAIEALAAARSKSASP